MSLSTHVLDVVTGRPAEGVVVLLETFFAGHWHPVAEVTTDRNGRCSNFFLDSADPHRGGVYRLRFETGAYFAAQQQTSLYPHIDVVFTIADDRHHHIPLLLAANGYTTYRGS